MANAHIPSLSQLDLEQFRGLIERESVTWSGQALKLRDIQQMIRTRVNLRLSQIGIEALTHLPPDSDLTADFASQNPMRMESVRLENGKNQLVVGLGDHARGAGYPRNPQKQPLNVLIPAHIDTVQLQTQDLLRLHYDPHNRDHAKGRGVYDMLGGALNGIALASDVKVPKGMNVFFAFTVDEERNSSGAKALIDPKQWEWWDKIDIVLSNEIGHIDIPAGEERMPYIVGRRGRHKYRLTLNVNEGSRGHFADSHVRSASQAAGEAKFLLVDLFNHGRIIASSKPLMRSHAHFGDEKLEFGANGTDEREETLLAELKELMGDRGGDIRAKLADIIQRRETELELREQYSTPTTREEFYYSIQSVPGRRIEESLKEQRAAMELIAKHCKWAQHGISWALTVNEDETSYNAYEMPEKQPIHGVVEGILSQISAGAYPARAPSVADENLYAQSILSRPQNNGSFRPHEGVICIPPVGDNAHRIDEWVSLESLARVRHAIRLLIEDPNGLIQLLPLKRKYQKK